MVRCRPARVALHRPGHLRLGAPRAGLELTAAGIVAMLCIPAATLATMASHPPIVPLVDLTAVALAIGLALTLRPAARRMRHGPRDSVWSNGQPMAAGVPQGAAASSHGVAGSE